MDIILKSNLPHQQKAIDLLNGVFKDITVYKSNLSFMNPTFDINNKKLKINIKEVQKEVHPSFRGSDEIDSYLNLDIKMETGTGKTYVYTEAMFELHKKYGFNKFIIVVPTLAIKAGTEKFITSPYVKSHFKDNCGYNCEIDLHILEARKTKKGKKYFPSAVREFVNSSNQVTNKIHVLLTNMHLLQDKKNSMLVRDDYDSAVEGFYKPSDAIKATKPIVIIDEPHRFTKTQKAFDFIEKQICPQMIIRFGATFPDKEIKEGKKKKLIKDYHNLLYNLCACDAFNQNLIKGISKEHFEPISKKNDKVKITSLANKSSVNFQYIKEGEKTVVYTLEKNDPLSIVTADLEGILITGIGKDFIELSNGQIKYKGEEFSTDIYSSSYQEQMLKLSIDRHFETEKENFNRRFKIKTLALFFIDDIHSYRKDDKSKKETYLKNTFERLLLQKLDKELDEITEYDSEEYKEYLLASKADINATHAGYFAQDNSNSDEAIAEEINEILFEKEKLLTIKNEDGSFNTRRFLFSKWTLKEGWDNPNVFTIAKLRSSGSENSKLQEVGRGLRLPVDENGNRISNEEFFLNYIVDFTEREFAEKLVSQINNELPQIINLSEEDIERVARKLGKDLDELFIELLIKKYIDRNRNVNFENIEAFYNDYPDFAGGLQKGKVKDKNKNNPRPVNIRKNRYEEIKELWEILNQKYLIQYEELSDDLIVKAILNIMELGTLDDVILTSKRQKVYGTDEGMIIDESSGIYYTIEKTMPYNEFLIKISNRTNIPITLIHKAILEYSKSHEIQDRHINEYSATNIIKGFDEWKSNNLQGRFNYRKTGLPIHPTALTNKDGTAKKVIKQGRIGTKMVAGEAFDKYLYDVVAYDSPLEHDNIQAEIDEVVVFGKIPRNSIRIPTINGGTYSPDFMYVVKKKDGTKEINIVVETKDVENKNSLRGIEGDKIQCAVVFFNQLKIDGYDVKFRTQLSNKKIKTIVNEILA
ncbi:type III restriction-modification system endonuclease [Clostridium sp.]|uniref:type III restriction-modification system endonuclease n=1 Tax=Clostridium sp. TaxID=1506 RepID=UPI003D6D0BE7